MGYCISIISENGSILLNTATGNERKAKPVVQLSEKGDFIQIFSSISQAERKTGIRHIYEAAHGERKSAGGYLWKLEGDYYNGK